MADATPGAATVQGRGDRARQQDGARRLGVAGQGWHLSSACARGSVRKRLSDGRIRLCPCVHELQGVMTTLMRNGRDRRSENPFVGHARKERVLLIGTDQRITSGPAARTAAPRGRIHDCTRIVSRKVRFFSLAPRAPSIHDPNRSLAGLTSRSAAVSCLILIKARLHSPCGNSTCHSLVHRFHETNHTGRIQFCWAGL